MKSKYCVVLLLLCFCLAARQAALADDNDDGGRGRARYYTVAQAKGLPDGRKVVLRGYIYRRIDDDEYMFRDSTGSIRIDLDDDDYRASLSPALGDAVRPYDDDDDDDDDDRRRGRGRKIVDPNRRVEIRGEIDRDDGRVTIDVDVARAI